MAITKSKYVDGFVLVVPEENLAAYKKMATVAAKVWKKHGALEYKECMGDDLEPSEHGMPHSTFGKMTKQKPGETVWFSYITYKSKAHRDQVNAKVMKDPIMNDPKYIDQPMPFDVKRLSMGGFKVMVDA